MKILYTASVLSHICQFHLPIMEMLQKEGHLVHVAANDNLGEKNGLKLQYADEYFKLPFQRSPRDPRNVRAYRELKKLINEQQYDVVICNTPVVGVLSRLAAKKARKHGTKVVYIAHGFHFYKGAPLKYWLYYPLEKFLAEKYTDLLITINQEDYERAKKRFKCPIEHINGVGVRSERYHPASEHEQKAMRAKEGLPEDAFVILCTKELMFDNNQKTILHAVAKVKDKIPELIMLFAGNGPDDQMLKELTNTMSLSDVVRFLGYRTDLEKLVPAVDLVVSCSWREGMPLNIIEAMLCARPIIASHNRGHDELIDDGTSGYLIDKFDTVALADRILQIRNDKGMAEGFGIRAYEKAQRYTAAFVVEQMREILNKTERGN